MKRWAVAVLLVVGACRGAGKPSAADAGAETAAPPPDAARIIVTKDRADLIFTYIDSTGAYHDVNRIDAVPEASRAQVLVRDLSKSPDELRAADYLYIADLRTPDSNGHYTCGAVSRRGFEREGMYDAASKAAEGVDGQSGNLVTVYSASWCGVCKQAKAFLKQKGIPFVDKDVEKDPRAEAELAMKAKARGLHPQGIPVIDVAGELMMGFDPDALTRLLRKKGIEKTL
jgi:glutaredoxin